MKRSPPKSPKSTLSVKLTRGTPASRSTPTKPRSKSPAKASLAAVSRSTARFSPQRALRSSSPSAPSTARETTPAPASDSGTKQSQLIALLGSVKGATMPQMMALTGWLPHTVRGALSGSLRKRLGLNVQYSLEDGVRVYRIVAAGEVGV